MTYTESVVVNCGCGARRASSVFPRVGAGRRRAVEPPLLTVRRSLLKQRRLDRAPAPTRKGPAGVDHHQNGNNYVKAVAGD